MNLKKEDINLYSRIHDWARKNVPKPDVCNRCKLPLKLELSNNSRMYIPHIDDWEWICHKCHGAKDHWGIGRKLTQEHKDKIGKANSIALKGKPSWRKGLILNSVKCICEYCHKEFFVGKWKYDHGRGRFCSLKCRKTFY